LRRECKDNIFQFTFPNIIKSNCR